MRGRTRNRLLALVLALVALSLTACGGNGWLKGTWTLDSVTNREGRRLTPEEFHGEAFDLGDEVSGADMASAAQQITHITELTLNSDGTGSARYMNPFGQHEMDCAWEEVEGELRIYSGGKVQFRLDADKRARKLTVEISESQRLSDNIVMQSTLYTLNYRKK